MSGTTIYALPVLVDTNAIIESHRASDIPEAVNWPDAQRGFFHHPVKKQVALT